MALTELGFERPTYDEILINQENRAKQLFGENIDTSELTALGKFIRINTKDIDTLYQTLEGVYYARFPNTASGLNLDRLCPFVGITRNVATYARHKVLFIGTAGETIGAGFEVSTENQSVVFHTVDDYTIGEDGNVYALVDCNDAGIDGNISSTAINTIVNPSADVESVAGIQIVIQGEEKESDTDLRKRFNEAVAGTGSGTAEAIKGAIMRVSGVDSCSIEENSSDETVNGIPPYSFECFVLSDETAITDQMIGEAIFSKKPLGIKSFGSVSVDIEDESGNIQTVCFERTNKKQVNVYVNITVNNFFEENGTEQIKLNIKNYISTLTNGQTLYKSALYGLARIDGVVDVSSIGIKNIDDYSYTATNIYADGNEVIRTSEDLITVEISIE